ncbi:UDP-N-acetylmuramate dehydrogenase [Horticoccus luteus]|uniref:UDP-N-acetylenolpyruvoylglucosamine reductase n=1 Tax=Horticoccus luteus TaxID=2862869 RepID=A0A8F9TTZ6_9BACT|nr:UDP-N-acetylmuramate dehydrogenase [Horticoccus luteus]QYM78080.1 UDP-N-acetylmuramate dehydrogenase [Horticoccus luteus]
MTRDVLPPLFGRTVQRVHCIGVGGMGLGPLAIFLARSGWTVTGEDDALSMEMRRQLQRGGVVIAPLPEACDLVVYSSAIAPAHAASAAAGARGIPRVRRGEMLAAVTAGRRLVAVCGSHGKTTTTAMLITVLRRAGVDAGYVLGGLFNGGAAPAQAGAADWVVAEIDESDGTIGQFAPELTVAVNLDWDHPDFYRSAGALETAFADLFQRTRGEVLVGGPTRNGAQEIDVGPQKRAWTFGLEQGADFEATLVADEGGRMTLRLSGKFQAGEATVRARGEFNARNATAALAAAQLMGVALTGDELADFPGVRRRQTVLSTVGGVTVMEDYAHHPAEIRALLASLRRPGGVLRVVFQPHRFSRTAQFKAEFADALAQADAVYLLDVYSAGEMPVAGGTSAEVADALHRAAPALAVHYAAGDGGWSQRLTAEVRSGDVVVFVGAGDIERRAREWLAARWDGLAAEISQGVSAATKVRREESLAPKTTMRVGGAARIYVEPATAEDLRATVAAARARGVRWLMLGRGSNLVVPDEGVDGVVISLAAAAWATFEARGDGRVWAGAGLRLKNLCGLAAKAGLTGFEFLEGVPGNLGGALRMNAGAMGGWTFDVVEAVTLMDADGTVRTLPKAEMEVGYRHCAELKNAVALGALLRPAAQVEADAVNRQLDVYRRKRQESQPREPSAGCIFKNPPGTSAGRLIDESGLKGARVGEAEVSAVHANFIVNRGGATAGDVLELVRHVRARVRRATGVELEPEVILFGQTWEETL